MNTEKEIKNHLIKTAIFVVAIVVLGVSTSYAYYTANISGKAEITDTPAARLDVTSTLTTTTAINNSKLSLIDAANKSTQAEKVEFSVTNASTSTVNGKYFVYLTDIKLSKNLYSAYLKWELVRVTSTGESPIATGNFANAKRTDTAGTSEAENAVTTVEDITLNTTILQIAKNTTDQLIFRIWLENDESVNQINLTNGSFQGKLKIEASPVK